MSPTSAVPTWVVEESGGVIVRPFDPDGAEKIAWFRDPGGNVMGLYQEP